MKKKDNITKSDKISKVDNSSINEHEVMRDDYLCDDEYPEQPQEYYDWLDSLKEEFSKKYKGEIANYIIDYFLQFEFPQDEFNEHVEELFNEFYEEYKSIISKEDLKNYAKLTFNLDWVIRDECRENLSKICGFLSKREESYKIRKQAFSQKRDIYESKKVSFPNDVIKQSVLNDFPYKKQKDNLSRFLDELYNRKYYMNHLSLKEIEKYKSNYKHFAENYKLGYIPIPNNIMQQWAADKIFHWMNIAKFEKEILAPLPHDNKKFMLSVFILGDINYKRKKDLTKQEEDKIFNCCKLSGHVNDSTDPLYKIKNYLEEKKILVPKTGYSTFLKECMYYKVNFGFEVL